MTAVIHHGPPGSFKSFGTIQRAKVPALQKGRTVITNIRGFDSLERIEEALNCKLPSEAKIIYVEADTDKGFQAMARFFHWAPKGALIAIDETQRVWSKKRNRDLKEFDLPLTDKAGELRSEEDIKRECPLWDGDYERPETVENAFDQHRHYNWDIYLTTPNISKVHDEVRSVCEVAYRHRGLGAILPIWQNKWKEFTHDSETSGKQLSHYMGSPKTYTADQRIFACYQSTKTGKAKGTSEARPLYRDPKLQMVFLGILLCIGFFIRAAFNFVETSPYFNKPLLTAEQTAGAADPQGRTDAGGHGAGVDAPAHELEAEFRRLGETEAKPAEPHRTDPAHTKTAPHNQDSPVFAEVDPLADYFTQDVDIRLSAAVYVPRRDALYYRVTVYDGAQLIDEFTQDEIRAYGYQERYGAAGLRLWRDGQRGYLVRPLIARRVGYVAPPEAKGSGASASQVVQKHFM